MAKKNSLRPANSGLEIESLEQLTNPPCESRCTGNSGAWIGKGVCGVDTVNMVCESGYGAAGEEAVGAGGVNLFCTLSA